MGTVELQAEVRGVNLRILAGDKIEDNLWISIVEVAVYDIYGNQVQVSAVCSLTTAAPLPSHLQQYLISKLNLNWEILTLNITQRVMGKTCRLRVFYAT